MRHTSSKWAIRLMAKKLLVIRNSALGDVAMTIPVVYSLAMQHPDLQIYFLTQPFFARLLVNAPANIHVIHAELKGNHKGLGGLRRLIASLLKYKFDYVADFHDVLRSWIISAALRLQGAKVARLHKSRRGRVRLLSEKAPQTPYIDRYVATLNRLGFNFSLDFKSLFANQAPAPLAPEHPAIGVAPFARYSNKTYPPSLMKQVCGMLAERGCSIYLFGGKGKEMDIMERWAAEMPRCHVVAGKYAIEDELALISQLDVMVSMDSANQHLASLAGTRVISVWGSTVPYGGFLAYAQSPDDAICLNLDCQPCTIAGSEQCPKGECKCMLQIKPETIVEKVMQSLSQP